MKFLQQISVADLVAMEALVQHPQTGLTTDELLAHIVSREDTDVVVKKRDWIDMSFRLCSAGFLKIDIDTRCFIVTPEGQQAMRQARESVAMEM